MIRALLFDFNGVVVDDEPVHLRLFQEVLQAEGVRLEKDVYYSKYLGMDDHDCLLSAAKDQGVALSETQIADLTERKAKKYQDEMLENPPFVPGVIDFIREAAKTQFLAIVSGALRSEIEMLLKQAGLEQEFSLIVAAGEVEHGKPDPEGYVKAMNWLNRDFVASSERLLPEECLVIEDSSWGLESAQAAGMPALATTTSFAKKDLPGALFYLKDFNEYRLVDFLAKVESQLGRK